MLWKFIEFYFWIFSYRGSQEEDKEIDELANRLSIVPNIQETSISFDIPIIQE